MIKLKNEYKKIKSTLKTPYIDYSIYNDSLSEYIIESRELLTDLKSYNKTLYLKHPELDDHLTKSIQCIDYYRSHPLRNTFKAKMTNPLIVIPNCHTAFNRDFPEIPFPKEATLAVLSAELIYHVWVWYDQNYDPVGEYTTFYRLPWYKRAWFVFKWKWKHR